MEPRSFNRGDGRYYYNADTNEELLQWSHGRLTVVTTSIRMTSSILPKLQWSHGRLTVVTAGVLQYGHLRFMASMEPRSFNRGDAPPDFEIAPDRYIASMEPRSFNRGDHFNHRTLALVPVRFNGATVV